ncbi:hypothetical protein PM082_006283 [Marasmius tenuissimus]|nr:hypothetical protein PM082_006283 [Marasmius tenuissimus]
MNSAYTNPVLYSVYTTASPASSHDEGTGQSAGLSGSSQFASSSTANATFATNLAHEPNSQCTVAVPYPSSSALHPHLPDSPHGVAPISHAHKTGYLLSTLPSSGGHFAPQQQWSTPYIDHHPSYNPPSFYPAGVTYHPTAYSHAYLSFAHTSHDHCDPSFIPFNSGSS